ncbi:MAG: DUF502 domain-containing protein [Betaproteobacteria bacterium]|nr:DUF502 domain-containing protein [Betaproteobacteria bacterium]PWB61242.1 MAG: hypothetical protein C3F16_08815 [Betaproteobacteria bacterium]
MRTRVMSTLRRYLIAGLLVWIPLAITFWVLALLVELMDQSLLIVPVRYRSDALLGFHLPGLGAVLTVVILLVTGAIAANFFGRRLLAFWESILGRIPIVRSIYGGVKQISDTLFSPDGKAFRRAVLVRYPHAGAWTVALVTGTPEHEVTDHLGHDQLSVFVPTTPNITAGFFLIVPRADTIELQMSVDQALKYIISMGVAEPPRLESRPESPPSGTDPNPVPSPKT